LLLVSSSANPEREPVRERIPPIFVFDVAQTRKSLTVRKIHQLLIFFISHFIPEIITKRALTQSFAIQRLDRPLSEIDLDTIDYGGKSIKKLEHSEAAAQLLKRYWLESEIARINNN